MNIVEALKDGNSSLRVSSGNKWLVYDIESDEWIVYEHTRYARSTVKLVETFNEAEAVAVLLKDKEGEKDGTSV